MICSMVKDLALDQPLTNGPSEQGLNARTGVEVVVRHGNHTRQSALSRWGRTRGQPFAPGSRVRGGLGLFWVLVFI